MRAARSLRARQDPRQRPRRRRVPAGAAHQRHRGARAPARAVTRRSSTARATCSPTCASSGSRTATVWLDLEPDPTPTVLSHLRTYSIGREVEIEDVGEEWAILSLIGPRAAELGGFEGLGPVHAQRSRQWEGIDVLGVATTVGVDLLVRSADAAAARELALSAGAVEVGEDAAEIVRIESGTPRFGAEMSAETMPAEAGIVDAAISFTKGCYIGQEPVARLHYKGRPNRHLRGLELSAPAEPGAELRLGEKTVGTIGSSCLSPARGPIALAIVRREAEPGVEVAVGEDGVTARVVDLPFG